MTTIRILGVASLGFLAAACSYSDTTTRSAPPPVVSAAPAPVVYTPQPSVTVVPAAQTPPAGVQAFRDEYGFRYDGQGNRLDRNGNIISPQSTRP